MTNNLSQLGKLGFLRESGNVERMHIKQHIGGYNNATHTWNMLVLLDQLYRPFTGQHTIEQYVALVRAILYHDSPERVTGDLPSPAKGMDGGALGRSAGYVEEIVRRELGIPDPHVDLSVYNGHWLKGLDLLELIMWCDDQIKLGNRNVITMRDKALGVISAGDFPSPIKHLAFELEAHSAPDGDTLSWWEWE